MFPYATMFTPLLLSAPFKNPQKHAFILHLKRDTSILRVLLAVPLSFFPPTLIALIEVL